MHLRIRCEHLIIFFSGIELNRYDRRCRGLSDTVRQTNISFENDMNLKMVIEIFFVHRVALYSPTHNNKLHASQQIASPIQSF